MDDLKFDGGFQELNENEIESIDGGWFFGRIMSGVTGITNGTFDRTVNAFQTIDRGIDWVVNSPANLIRAVFGLDSFRR